MKKIIFLIFFVFLFADVSNIIGEIKNIENYTPKFKHFVNYNIFVNNKVKNQYKKSVVVSNTNTNSNLTLYAVFQNKVNINGIWLKVGEVINGYKIIKIASNKVILKKDGKIKKLVLKPNILKVRK